MANEYVLGQQKLSFKDPLDNKVDLSEFLSTYYGFVPVLSLITEPALDFGVAGGLAFVNRKYDEDGVVKPIPPDMFGVGGMYTGNHSWGVGGVYSGFWAEDKIRYRGVLGYGAFNLDYYRTGPRGNERNFGFEISGLFILQEFNFRLAQVPLFLGVQYTYTNMQVGFDLGTGIDIPGVSDWELDTHNGGLGPILTFDNRDNTFTPNSGIRTQLVWQYYDPVFGGVPSFHRLQYFGLGYYPFSDNFTAGLRVDARYISDGAPFYSLPYVELRGVPAMRYQGNYVVLVETEERWDFSQRWSAVVFGGWGKGVFADQSFKEAPNAWNVGIGGRYLLARLFGLYMGLDVARGPEDWTFYVIFGSEWLRF